MSGEISSYITDFEINTEILLNGIYVLELHSRTSKSSKKFIKD